MAKKKASKKKAAAETASGYGTAWTFKVIGLLAASLVWVALVAALASHDPRDPGRELGAIEGVVNQTPTNWLGPVGAVVSQTVFVFMGWGAWVLMGAAGFALVTLMRGKMVTHWPLRAIGSLLVAAAVATGAAQFGEPIAVWFGAQGAVPAYTWGGMAGSFFAIELSERLAGLGTAMIAGAALVTGLVLAVDEVVLMLPYRAAAWVAGRLTGVPLPDAKRLIAIPGAIVGWFRLPKREKPELSPKAGLSKDKADRLAELRAKRAAKQAEEEEAFADDGSDFRGGCLRRSRRARGRGRRRRGV